MQCFPAEHSLRTRTQVRHECTQVHDEKRSSKLAKSISVPFGADKPLISWFVIQRKIYTRAKSRILSRRKPCACMRSLSRHGLLGDFSAKLIFMLTFRKAPHGPWMPCNHFCIHLKCQRTGTSAKATNLIEGWMIRHEGTWSNDHSPRLVRLAFFEVANFWGSFFFPEEEHVERSNWEPSSWASCFSFLDLSKKKRSFWIRKWNFEGQWFS